MKKTVLKLLLLFTFCLIGNSQDKCIKVTYKILKSNLSKSKSPSKHPEIKKGVTERVSELEYSLYCNSFESLFFLEEKMQLKENLHYKLATIIGGRGFYYKNINDSIKFKQKDSYGSIFNIISPFVEYNWEITKETKNINGYLCYKATAVFEEYDYLRKTTNTFKPEVWFTPDITTPFGPKGYDGLPGLVLEATMNGKTIYYATKIEFDVNSCDKVLKKPKKGKNISKQDYLKLLANKSPKS